MNFGSNQINYLKKETIKLWLKNKKQAQRITKALNKQIIKN